MKKINVEQWIPLAAKVTKEFVPFNLNQKLEDTDEFSDAFLALYFACENFDPDYRTKKGKSVTFKTYAWVVMARAIIQGRKARDSDRKLESVVLSDLERPDHAYEILDLSNLEEKPPVHLLKLFFEENDLDTKAEKRYKNILREYYLSDLTLEEVGKKYGIGKERVRQLVNKGLEVIKQKFASIIAQEKF